MAFLKWHGMQLETIFSILLDLGNDSAINKYSSQIYLSHPFYQPSFRGKNNGQTKTFNKSNSLLEPENIIVTNRENYILTSIALHHSGTIKLMSPCNRIYGTEVNSIYLNMLSYVFVYSHSRCLIYKPGNYYSSSKQIRTDYWNVHISFYVYH